MNYRARRPSPQGGDPLEPLRVGGTPTPPFVGLKGGLFII
jgi:hypothetical protein